MDPEIRGFILNPKAEYLPMRNNEIATVCYVRFGERPHGRAARRVLETNPTAIRMSRRFKRHHEMVGVVERGLAIEIHRADRGRTRVGGRRRSWDSSRTSAMARRAFSSTRFTRVHGTSGDARLNHWKISRAGRSRR